MKIVASTYPNHVKRVIEYINELLDQICVDNGYDTSCYKTSVLDYASTFDGGYFIKIELHYDQTIIPSSYDDILLFIGNANDEDDEERIFDQLRISHVFGI